MNKEEILDTVVKLCRSVGEYQLSAFRRHAYKVNNKGRESDLVTEVDFQSEKMILDFIEENFPEHSFLSEESGASNKDSDYEWVVDPLDGTNNFVHGLPMFCVSIALKYQGEVVLGVVYLPKLDECFYAVKNNGAFLNGVKLEVSKNYDLSKAVVASGFPYDRKSKLNNVDFVAKVIPEVRGFRRMGSAAIDLCYTAAGFFDAYWELKINEWDIAAGGLIIKEAGGVMEQIKEVDCFSVIAGNVDITEKIRLCLF